MKYEYRKLSEEKAKEIDEKGFIDNLGKRMSINSNYSVTNKEETLVFRQTWHSHEQSEPDRYFLEYKGCYYFINMFLKDVSGEKTESGDCWHYLYEIADIYNASRNANECVTEEILEVLRDVLYIKNHYGKRVRKPSEKTIIEVVYRGE